jgi:large subunit ribosomal protein L29
MKTKDFRDLTTDELVTRVDQLKDELFNLRFQLATGQLENPMRIGEVRKSIAQSKTILREREINNQRA